MGGFFKPRRSSLQSCSSFCSCPWAEIPPQEYLQCHTSCLQLSKYCLLGGSGMAVGRGRLLNVEGEGAEMREENSCSLSHAGVRVVSSLTPSAPMGFNGTDPVPHMAIPTGTVPPLPELIQDADAWCVRMRLCLQPCADGLQDGTF